VSFQMAPFRATLARAWARFTYGAPFCYV